VTFSVAASGTDPKNFQWKKDGTDISGATAANLTLSNVQTTDSGTYAVLVSNSAGSVLSQGATLTVTDPVLAPTIRSQPVSASIHNGETATFTVNALGTAPLVFKWFHGGAELSGQSGSTLTIQNAQSADAGTYLVEVSNAAGTVQSSPVSLTVTPLQILSVTENGANTVLAWNGITGRNYSVLGSTSVVGQWQVLTPISTSTANGVISSTVPNQDGTLQLFRVATAP
jgi:hypothetical protein